MLIFGDMRGLYCFWPIELAQYLLKYNFIAERTYINISQKEFSQQELRVNCYLGRTQLEASFIIIR